MTPRHWLHYNTLRCLHTPPQSLDLSPVEHFEQRIQIRDFAFEQSIIYFLFFFCRKKLWLIIIYIVILKGNYHQHCYSIIANLYLRVIYKNAHNALLISKSYDNILRFLIFCSSTITRTDNVLISIYVDYRVDSLTFKLNNKTRSRLFLDNYDYCLISAGGGCI